MVRAPSGEFWPVGRVSAMLGVPAVTIRSWERRYDVGPARRSEGLHRRYSRLDVQRLQRMRNLIAAGTPARAAAALSAEQAEDTGAEPWAAIEARRLVDLAAASRFQVLAEELRSCLAHRGVPAAWDEVIRPALKTLETRYLEFDDCTDIELVLTQAVSDAVDRHVDQLRSPPGDVSGPVLLVCCPGERHDLPLKVLRSVLLERGVPAVLLGPGLAGDGITAAVARITPSVVVMWSLIRRRELTAFRAGVMATGATACAAGPGWPRHVGALSTLETAADQISSRWFAATESRRTARRRRTA